MKKTAEEILKDHRSMEASSKYCIPIKEVLSIIPGEK
jgi:phosphoenolpyruvate phosphomutase